jgi:hypothetical protein
VWADGWTTRLIGMLKAAGQYDGGTEQALREHMSLHVDRVIRSTAPAAELALDERVVPRKAKTEPPAKKLSRSAARLKSFLDTQDSIPTYAEIADKLQMGQGTISKAKKELLQANLWPIVK